MPGNGDGKGISTAVTVPAAAAGPVRSFLFFEAGGGRFGLWSSVVREAVRAVAVSPLPKAPAGVLGVINLRGRAIPVLSLRIRFGLPPKDVEVSDHFIVATAGDRIVAFHVDQAVGLVDVAERDVEEAGKVTTASEYLDGIVKMPDGLILIHDPATFLSHAEGQSLDAAMGEPA